MWQDLFTAFALMLVLEGLMPFLHPPSLRKALNAVAELDDKAIRIAGLASMLSGVLLLYWLR